MGDTAGELETATSPTSGRRLNRTGFSPFSVGPSASSRTPRAIARWFADPVEAAEVLLADLLLRMLDRPEVGKTGCESSNKASPPSTINSCSALYAGPEPDAF